ncbi:MAG: NAD(P)/FAD-dependent oxidoreductase [Hyphomicrobiales bacterium]
MPSFDAIVIGGGTNGLACAAKLGSSGRRVLLLEGRPVTGGAAAGGEFAPGYVTPGLAHLVYLLDPRVEQGLALARHGYSSVGQPLASTAVAAGGDHLVLDRSYGASVSGTLSEADRAAWAALRRQLLAFAGVLAPFKTVMPPRIAKAPGNDYLKLAKFGLAARMLGRDQFRELLRMLLINVHDVLNDELGDARLKGLLAFDATLGSWLGPRSPNSLILLLNRLAGQAAGETAAVVLPRGGTGALAAAMEKAAAAAGVAVRTGAKVAGIAMDGDRVAGVTLADGEEIQAPIVVSAINPKTTFLDLVGVRHLDTGFVKRIRDQKSRGAAAKLHLALKGEPRFRGADLKTRLVIAPSENAVERAFNPVKYGEVPERPVMEVIVPSAHEAGYAPAGHHVISAIVQYAPHQPKLGHDRARAQMLENSLSVLEDHAPGLRDLVVGAEMLMPYDIEARTGMVGGNWHHGELSVEQMFFLRPLPGLAQYRTPVAGLWLGGAGCHPGGGISGAAGWNAAEAIIREAGR